MIFYCHFVKCHYANFEYYVCNNKCVTTLNIVIMSVQTSYLVGLVLVPASLPCLVFLVLLVAAAKILAVKLGPSIDPTQLPCLPTCPVLVQ
jgi:hypothetical protein